MEKKDKKIYCDGQQTFHLIIDEVGFCKIEGEDQATTGKQYTDDNYEKLSLHSRCIRCLVLVVMIKGKYFSAQQDLIIQLSAN